MTDLAVHDTLTVHNAPTPPTRGRARVLAGHEYRAALRSRSLLSLLVILVLATIASIYVGAAEYRGQVADYEAYRTAAEASGITQITPAPFALLSLLRGAMEYLEIVGAVIAITLGYLSVARERVSRTLPLIQTRPVSVADQTAGTALGLAAVITTVVVLTGVVAVVALGIVTGDWPSGTEALQLLLAYGAASLYMTVFAFLGFILSTRSERPLNGFMLALAVWVVVVLVIPQIGDTLDADNQIPGGLFASLGLGKSGEDQILAHFSIYERIRTTIEATSFAKHFERFVFAMSDVKPRDRALALPALLQLKQIEVVWLGVYGVASVAWLRRVIRRRSAIPTATTTR